jgi:hypothetical protein
MKQIVQKKAISTLKQADGDEQQIGASLGLCDRLDMGCRRF